MTEAGAHFEHPASIPLPRALEPTRLPGFEQGDRLGRLHAYFAEGCGENVRPALESVLVQARSVREGCGDDDIGDDLASVWYASAAVVELAAALELDTADVRGAAAAVAETCALPLPAARYVLFSQTAGNVRLLELPPLLALEIQLNLLLGLDVLADVSVWHRTTGGIECLLALGYADEPSRRVRAEAKAVLRRSSRLSLLGGSRLRSAPVNRFGEPSAAIVGRCGSAERDVADAFLAEAAGFMSPIVEREHLLEHASARERTLVAASERRLMRLGFDLHDGPIQDVLALAAEVRLLQQQVYPFVLADHREIAYGRFEDLTARLVDLDRHLREIAHSLETKSVLSRPLGEILHREVDNFAERTGLEASLEIRGDPDSLSSAQRITVFRAIQEALANVREHSGAHGGGRSRPCSQERDRGPDRRRRDGVRSRESSGQGRAARPPRAGRNRRARPHAGRHVRRRELPGGPDQPQIHAAALGAARVVARQEFGPPGRSPSYRQTAPNRRLRTVCRTPDAPGWCATMVEAILSAMLIPRRARGKPAEPEEVTDPELAQRVLAHASSPEEKLERLLAERSRELEEQASRFEQAMQDLERREELLRDMRASVERLLRLGTSDLTEREVELQELGKEFMDREARLSTEEAELSRRRSELGAVELKREAIERRERALAAREEEIEAAQALRVASPPGDESSSEQDAVASNDSSDPVSLLFVPGQAYRLVEVEQRTLTVGTALEVDGEVFYVTRLGSAPLPGDMRRCAYLERGAPGSSVSESPESEGSS